MTKRLLAPRTAGATVGHLMRVVDARNRGVSFGLLAGHPALAAAATVTAAVVVTVLALRSRGPLQAAEWGLVVGGAAGNLVDRLADGAVLDWLRVWGYPAAFNLADIAIRLGAVLLLIGALLSDRAASRRPLNPVADPPGSRTDRHLWGRRSR